LAIADSFPFLINDTMELTIKDKQYTIKYTLRALFIYEQITGKAFKLETLTDQYLFSYSLILANIPDIEMSFDDFITECDLNPELITSMQQFIAKEAEKQAVYVKDKTDSKKKN